jgi:hypothetical protein
MYQGDEQKGEKKSPEILLNRDRFSCTEEMIQHKSHPFRGASKRTKPTVVSIRSNEGQTAITAMSTQPANQPGR